LLDKALLEPTALQLPRRQQLDALFTRMTATIKDGHRYRLELRKSKQLRANALALPSGIVIVTDDLVTLAENDEEIEAVLAHELGHVQGRHALRQLLQSAGVAAMAAAVLGDVSSISSVASAVPTIIQARNSREFEIEADQAARQWLAANGIAARRFDDILCRLERGNGNSGNSAVKDFLSTHPPTGARAHC
jgi:Zn-dependent protease with chaperone function